MTRDRYQSGSVVLVGDQWKLRYYEASTDGKRVRKSVPMGWLEQYPTKKKAKLAADVIMRKVREAAAVTTFSHLAIEYAKSGMGNVRGWSATAYVSLAKHMIAAFGTARLDDLCSAEGIIKLEGWLNGMRTRKDAPVAAATRRKARTVLWLHFRMAAKRGWINADQLGRVKLIDIVNTPANTAPKRKRAPLTVDLYRALLADPELPHLCKLVLQICTTTGMRACEAFGLRVEDVDFAHSKFWIRRSVKNGKWIDEPKTAESKRTEPMHDDLAAQLRTWLWEKPTIGGWLFGSPDTERPYLANGLQRMYLRPAGNRLGIPSLGWHTFRHTARSWVKRQGVALEDQMAFMGHTNPAQTLRYGVDGVDRADELRPTQAKLLEMIRKGA